MALRNFRPLTPTLRFKSIPAFQEVTKSKSKPVKSLTEPKKRSGGRNNKGRVTSRHIGGGHKQKYRKVDFKRKKRDIVADVLAIQVRSESDRAHRSAQIQRRRAKLHSGARWSGSRRQGDGG